MELKLDFSVLDTLTDTDKGVTKQNTLFTTPQEPKIEGLALIKITQEQEDRQRWLAIYERYQNNIKLTEAILKAMLEGAKAGEPAQSLLLKACKAIALMTDNKVFYNQMYSDLKAVYGEGLREKMPLKWELYEVKERLVNLRDAIKNEGIDRQNKQRIQKAIEAHERREKDLLKMLGEPEGKLIS